MNMFSSKMKKRSAAAAYGSVKAEGLKPSAKTQKRVKQYVDGKITKTELRRSVIAEMRQTDRKK
jgi:antitoxin VbhA-like protein